MDCIVPMIPTEMVGLNDPRAEPNKTMYASIIDYKNATYYKIRYTSLFYVYSTVKIIQVPPITSTNGVFQCTTTSEFLACQSSITLDSNPYLGSYYISQPIATTQLPSPPFNNALQSAGNISVHVDTIIAFPTPFTYLPSVGDRLEELGYVPRSMLDWMLRQDDYIGQASLLTSCSPGGPPLAPLNEISAVSNAEGLQVNTLLPATFPVITDEPGDMQEVGPVLATAGKDLTVSTAVTVTSAGCFNPEACPTIRASRALTANSASADFISQTVKQKMPATTVAPSRLDDATGTADRALPSPFTFGGQVFTPHPAGFSIDGTTISAGGPGVTIAGTAIQLESSKILKIGTSLISMSNTAILDDDLHLGAYSVGGQVFTPNWIAFPIAGITISAEGPGVTIAGTPIRLEASGLLRIGTSMASIANIASTTGLSWLATYTVGTEILTPNPTTFAVTGTTISAGDAYITSPRTPSSLETSGDRGTGGSTLTSTPKHPPKTSSSPSGGDNNLIVRKLLGILFVMYLIYRILACLG